MPDFEKLILRALPRLKRFRYRHPIDLVSNGASTGMPVADHLSIIPSAADPPTPKIGWQPRRKSLIFLTLVRSDLSLYSIDIVQNSMES